MRCKPGDLAVVVKSTAGNEGKIVRCIRLMTSQECDAFGYRRGPIWKVEGVLKTHRYNGTEWALTDCCPDEILSPIRDPGDDAVDETLVRKTSSQLREIMLRDLA